MADTMVTGPSIQAKEDQMPVPLFVCHANCCRSVLAAYKVPKNIFFRADLPKGPTGKVQRRLLK